jgi:hypothetical protein
MVYLSLELYPNHSNTTVHSLSITELYFSPKTVFRGFLEIIFKIVIRLGLKESPGIQKEEA